MEYNLADLWETVVDTVADREAVVCGERRLTYAQVDERANRLAHHLTQQGVGPGDHVALYLYNSTEYLEAMLAAFKIRAVPVNVNYRYVTDELRYLLHDADATVIVFHRAFAPKLHAIIGDLPLLTHHIAVDDGTDADVDQLGAVDYDVALAAAPATRDFPPRSADDLYILYTGGTTGMPKGVMWRHEDAFFGAFGGGGFRNEITRPEEIAERALEGRTRCLPACPFMHGTAHWMAFSALFAGGSVVIDPDHHFDPTALWDLVGRERVNFLVIVGDAFARPLAEAIDDRHDLAACTVVLSGGAILSPTVKELLAERLPGCLVIDGYGSSESGSQGQTITTHGSAVSRAPRFTVGDDTLVLDDDLRPAPIGVEGRLARRGRVPIGYYKDPVKSAATFPVIDGVRWSVPGDHARLEPDGSITLLGRGSVSINTGGEKVYPEEVEAAMKSHPAIFDAVVVGVPDDRWGERVVAVASLRPGPGPTLDEVASHVREHLAGYKVPRELVVVDAIQRSPSGKPDYRWARAHAIDVLGLSVP